jgi:hypothetical protein
MTSHSLTKTEMSHLGHHKPEWILIAVTSNNVRLEINGMIIETILGERDVRLNGEDQGGWTCAKLRKWCRKNKIVLPKKYWYY